MAEHCILVIEDQEDLAEIYEATLKRAGYKVRNAYTGEEGFAEFRANGADCVILDMTLPEMHGAQVMHQIREVNASVPIIVITGETGDLYRQQCERLGAHAYLSKPVDYDALLAVIETAISEPREEVEVVTLRLPKQLLEQLSEIDSNLVNAITQLVEERQQTRTRTHTSQKS